MNAPPPREADRHRTYTRREFMVYTAVLDSSEGKGVLTAIADVEAWAAAHPDVNLDESLTWTQWLAEHEGQ